MDDVRVMARNMVTRPKGVQRCEYVMRGSRVLGFVTVAGEDGMSWGWSAYKFIDAPKGAVEPGTEEYLGAYPTMSEAVAKVGGA